MKTTTVSCDVCHATKDIKEKTIQVIFTTEQTEGRYIAPYLSDCKMDICACCLNKVLKGNYLYGRGAMGFNTYLFDKAKI